MNITDDQFAVSITPKSPPSCVQDITLAANIRQKGVLAIEAFIITGGKWT